MVRVSIADNPRPDLPGVYVAKQTENEEIIMSRVEINKQAPEFTAPDFNGNSVSLADFTDRVNVLLVFNRSFS